MKLYKLVLSIAFISQITNLNSGYSTDNNDIRFVTAENGDCFIEKSGKILSMEENNQNEYNQCKTYDIDNSNCIAQLINDVSDEYNNYDSDSDNEISRISNFLNNIKNDKYRNEDYENSYRKLIQNSCNHNNIEIINNDNIFNNVYEMKLPDFESKINVIDIKPVDIKFNKIIEEPKLSLDFDSHINIGTIVGTFTNTKTIETTYTIAEYKLPDPKELLKDIDFNKLIEVNGNANLYAKNKTCCDCLVNIFKKATSCIKNVFNSNKNTNIDDNNVTERLVSSDIEYSSSNDNNYDADISSDDDNKDNIIYYNESNSSKNSSEKSLLDNSNED